VADDELGDHYSGLTLTCYSRKLLKSGEKILKKEEFNKPQIL